MIKTLHNMGIEGSYFNIIKAMYNKATVATLHHSCSNTGSFNLLCQARDRTCVLALQRFY